MRLNGIHRPPQGAEWGRYIPPRGGQRTAFRPFALGFHGIGWDRLLYLNFEDDRLHPIDPNELSLIPEVFYRQYPRSRDRKCWFFLDEIQAAPGWERFVRRLLETEKVSLILTGSSAKLLSREIATSLRGRSLASELLPFSFSEALQHAGVERPDKWPVSSKLRSQLANSLERYPNVVTPESTANSSSSLAVCHTFSSGRDSRK